MLKLKNAMVFATFITIILITGMTIGSEISDDFKKLLVKGFGHHWVAKSIISLVSFFSVTITYYLFIKEFGPEKLKRVIILTLGGSICCAIIIFGYYIYHFLML